MMTPSYFLPRELLLKNEKRKSVVDSITCRLILDGNLARSYVSGPSWLNRNYDVFAKNLAVNHFAVSKPVIRLTISIAM